VCVSGYVNPLGVLIVKVEGVQVFMENFWGKNVHQPRNQSENIVHRTPNSIRIKRLSPVNARNVVDCKSLHDVSKLFICQYKQHTFAVKNPGEKLKSPKNWPLPTYFKNIPINNDHPLTNAYNIHYTDKNQKNIWGKIKFSPQK